MGKAAGTRPRKKRDGQASFQYAALPWRRGDHGRIEVMLITSRGTGRWVIPKGWPMKGKTRRAAAEREAWEEAGVHGRIGRKPIGGYAYGKRLDDGRVIDVRVEVFPLEVGREDDDWPEKLQRERSWTDPAQAARLVDEPELRELILAFSPE
jgi:8-oxo-dGTP pyrophosphatase MutT (NUDIX family)